MRLKVAAGLLFFATLCAAFASKKHDPTPPVIAGDPIPNCVPGHCPPPPQQ